MKKIQYITSLEQGKDKFLHPIESNKIGVKEAFSKLDKTKKYLVSIELHLSDRTSKQNKYFHVIVLDYMTRVKDLGRVWTFYQAKQMLKIYSGFIELVTDEAGKEIALPRSSSKASKKVFNELMEGVEAHYIDLFGHEPPKPPYEI